MDTNLLNNYVLKAIDAYPYELEEAVENITYALSYDNNNSYALFMMGRVQAEQLGDYEKAKEYYAESLAHNIDFHKVYAPYILVLIWNEDYIEAQKLIDFAFKVKGINNSEIWVRQGQLWERLKKYNKALKAFKEAQMLCLDNEFMDCINSEKSRITNKLKLNNKKNSSSKKKNKKKKK